VRESVKRTVEVLGKVAAIYDGVELIVFIFAIAFFAIFYAIFWILLKWNHLR
jgi:hypothetical protein